MSRRLLLGVLLLALGVVARSEAQTNEKCKLTTPNRSGTAGADITVSTAAVTVIAANTALCKAMMTNLSQTNAIRCRAIGTDPTATTGFKVLPYQVLALDQDAQLGLKCIRDTTATGDVTVTVLEFEP